MEEQKFKTVITSDHKLMDLHIRETLEYKDLIFLFVKRDFTAKYKQTILGPAWAIIQPLLTTVVFTVVFKGLANLTTADISGDYMIPGFLFYMAGNICWSYFSSTLHITSLTFLNNRTTMGKVYFPRLAAPIATAISNLISFGIQFVMFLLFWIFFLLKGGTSIVISKWLFMVPLCIFQLMLLSLGCGIIISSVTTKYRDMAMLVTFGLQLWQYASPIAYGLQLVPEKYMWIYMLNPVTPIIVIFRHAMFGFGYFNLSYYLVSWLFTIILFVIGLIMFSKIERNFMDTI